MNEPHQGGIHALLLAAGQSSRMGGQNKLLAEIGGVPLICRVARELAAAGPASTLIVTGHERQRIEMALSGLPVEVVHNPDYASGLASSLQRGVRALPVDAAGALIMLGDLPEIRAADHQRLMRAFHDAGGEAIVRATGAGVSGHPVILPASLFAQLDKLSQDQGARRLIEGGPVPVVEIELGRAALMDIDTPEDLAALAGHGGEPGTA